MTPVARAWLTRALVAAVVVAALLALVASWEGVGGVLAQARPGWLAVALLLGVGNVLGTGVAWRAALGALGSSVPLRPALVIFSVGQLGKYLPGSIWPVLVQAELTGRRGVPRSRVVVAGLLALAQAALVALLVGLAAVPALTPDAPRGVVLGAAAVLVLAGAALGTSPRVVGAAVSLLLRVTRRPLLPAPLTRRGLAGVLVWGLVAMLLLAAHAAALAVGLGLSWSTAVVVGSAMALAQVAGLLAVPVPAGLGVREAVLVAVVAPVASAQVGIAVAVLSRLLMTLADLGTALAARLVAGRR